MPSLPEEHDGYRYLLSYRSGIRGFRYSGGGRAEGTGRQLGRLPSRLFFTPEKAERLKRRVDTDETLRAAWQEQLELAERLLEEKLISKEHAESGSGQHGNYGGPSSQVSRLASVLGLAYRITGEKRYAEKVRDALIHYGGLKRWAGNANHDPPWHSELNTARFCFAYAVGYDSIHDFLSEQERATIRESMIRLGILPTLNDWVLSEQRIHALDSMGHNCGAFVWPWRGWRHCHCWGMTRVPRVG